MKIEATDGNRDGFNARLAALEMAPLWEVMNDLVKPEPAPASVPFAWRYEDVRPLLEEAGETIPTELAERRVLILENPELRGSSGVTQSLYAGLQVVRPGEVAPPHRHSQAALRFCLESDGAFTMINDRKVQMKPFDLVLTPPFTWHEHGNHGVQDAVWLDGLDIPVVRFFDAEFAEHGAGFSGNARPDTLSQVQSQGLLPLDSNAAPLSDQRGRGVVHYPFAAWRQSLLDLLDADGGDTAVIEFRNPVSGGPAMPTLAAFARIVKAGATVSPARSTESQVFVIAEGAGRLFVGDHSVAMEPKTVAVAPSWSRVHIEAEAETLLFSYSDRAAQNALGLWRLEGAAL